MHHPSQAYQILRVASLRDPYPIDWLALHGIRGCKDFCAIGVISTLITGKGESPIFADTKIGTVPGITM
jgi:hypothetical protein